MFIVFLFISLLKPIMCQTSHTIIFITEMQCVFVFGFVFSLVLKTLLIYNLLIFIISSFHCLPFKFYVN